MAKTFGTQEQIEKALLVGVSFDKTVTDIEGNLAELKGLAKTAGLEVVGYVFQNVKENTPATLIGKGKVEEVAMAVSETNADVVILDCELTGSQINNISEVVKVKVIDINDDNTLKVLYEDNIVNISSGEITFHLSDKEAY